jgi:hypothetical protein
MTQHLGDFAEDATVDFKWSTNDGAGASVTRATNGTVSVYIGNGTAQVTAGVTDTEDFDSLTGIHHCRIDLSADAAYATGSECQVVLSGSTIDGESVNAVLASFSIERAGGALALLKHATNGLAAIKTQTGAIETDTQDLQGRTPAALIGGRMDVSVGAMASDVLTAAALNANAVTEIQTGLATAAALATVDSVVDAIQAKTDNLPSDPADASVIVSATDAILTAVGGVQTTADSILDDTGTAGVVVATASKTGYRLSATGVDDILDEVVEGTTTLRQSQRLHNAVLGGKASGLETTAATFRDLGDTKDVVVATVDGDGNRSAVTHDLT